MTRAASVGRRVLRFFGFLIGGLLALIVVSFLFLLTPPGERLLKDFAVSRANDSLKGSLSIAELDYGGDSVELRGVALETEDGERVASAESVRADVAVLGLLSGRLHLEQLAVSDYRVRVEQLPDGGFNLGELTAPADPAPQPADKTGAMPIVIDHFELRRGVVGVHLNGGQPGRDLYVEELAAEGALSYRNQRLRGQLELHGQALEPMRAPLDVTARARIANGSQIARAELSLGEANLFARVRLPEPIGEPGLDLAELQARVRLNVPAFETQGFRYGPLELAARWEEGVLHVSQAHLELPGMKLEHDASSGELLAAELRISALQRTASALEALLGATLPSARGHGQLQLRIEGPVSEPRLQVEGHFASLAVSGYQADDVELQGAVQDLTKLDQARLTLQVASLDAAGRQLRDIQLALSRQGRQVALDATLDAPQTLELHVAGRFAGEGYERLRLGRLELSYPEATWSLASAPAVVRLPPEGVQVEQLELQSGPQRIALELNWKENEKSARATLDDVRLASLPASLMPDAPSASGTVGGELTFEGPPQSPTASADLTVSQLELEGLEVPFAEVDARYQGGRVAGTFGARALGGLAEARFDLPAELPPPSDAALDAHVNVRGVELERALAAFEARLPQKLAQRVKGVGGELRVTGQLGGTYAQPDLEATVKLDGGSLTLEGLDTYRNVQLVASLQDDQLQLRRLAAETERGSFTAHGRATRLGDSMRFRYRLQVRSSSFPLPLDDPMVASLRAQLQGVASPARVTSQLTLRQLKLFREAPAPPAGESAEPELAKATRR